MNRIVLTGCHNEPLGSYLQGLGAWRAITRVIDPEARAHWEGGHMVLTSRLKGDEVVERLHEEFTPVPIVSPWNGASGFAGNGKNVQAERALATVRQSSEQRLAELREAVLTADEVVAEARRRGWESKKEEELWAKTRKPDVVRLCRNRFPDSALPWIDAAVVLGQDEDPSYSRLLGTGGNFGRQDLSATYIQRVLAVLVDSKLAKRSTGWLRAALFGDESVPYLREAVGQFDPGRSGGVQSSPFEKADDKGFANPWSYLLALEGTLLFASAVVRRQGASMSRAAVPFVVGARTAGFPSGADDEQVLGEIWTPEWERPAGLAEVEHLLGEGRADWRGGPARSGLDFVRAIAALGVDRGISHFTRHVFAERLGQNPLAVPAGRIKVEPRGSVGLLADLDRWMSRLSNEPPAAVRMRLRQVEAAMFTVARTNQASAMRQLLVALGRLDEAVSLSGASRESVQVPLVIRKASSWWAALEADSPELRLAGAFASAGDAVVGDRAGLPPTLRMLLTPVKLEDGQLRWTGRPALVTWGDDVLAALAGAHRRRALPGTVPDPAELLPDHHKPAVRGVLSAYSRGLMASLPDVVDLAAGLLDEDLLGDYLRGLLLLDWSRPDAPTGLSALDGQPVLVPPPLSVLLPFFAVDPLPVRLREKDLRPQPVVLRPGPEWMSTLRATGHAEVVRDALRRLRAAGITESVNPDAVARAPIDPDRLAAALLLRLAPAVRVHLLGRIAVLPRQISEGVARSASEKPTSQKPAPKEPTYVCM